MAQPLQEAIITKISGPVLTVQYPLTDSCEIHDLLCTQSGVHLEVSGHEGPGLCKCLALESTYGLYCGMKVTNSHSCIPIPVGEQMLGRVIDVLGNLIDGGPEIPVPRLPIYREAPVINELQPYPQLLQSGLKCLSLPTLFAP